MTVRTNQLFLLGYVIAISVASVISPDHFLPIYYAASMTLAVYISISALGESPQEVPIRVHAKRKKADAPWSIRLFTWILEKLSYETRTTF